MEGPLTSATIESLQSRVGQELGVSQWFRIEQDTIDAFADLTHDRYFIHVDPERAAATAFGGTIAHGFLTLSLLAPMAYQVCPAVEGTKSQVNYGFDRLRFVAPVRRGARIRGRFVLASLDVQPAKRWQAVYAVTVEIEGETKPALVAQWIAAGFL